MNEEENIKDDESEDMQIYEVGYHILPTVDESSLTSEVGILKELVSQNGGFVIAESLPTLMSLAYPIYKVVDAKNKSFDKGYFGFLKFELPPINIEKINKLIKANQKILRFIIVKTVRENTLYYNKEPRVDKEKNLATFALEDEVQTKVLEKGSVSEAELDKSIDELVIV